MNVPTIESMIMITGIMIHNMILILSKCIHSPRPSWPPKQPFRHNVLSSPIHALPKFCKGTSTKETRMVSLFCLWRICLRNAGVEGMRQNNAKRSIGTREYIYIYILYMDRIRDSKSSLWCRMSDGPGWPCRASIDSFNLRMSLWKTSLAANLLMICCLNLIDTWGACWRTSKSTLQTAVKHRFVSVSCWHSEGNTRSSLNFNNPAFWNHASYDCTCKIGDSMT